MFHIVRRSALNRSSRTGETMQSADRRRMRREQLIAILEEATAMAVGFNSSVLGSSSSTTQLTSVTPQGITQPPTSVHNVQCAEGDHEEAKDSSKH
jgi:hypothetical protein